MVQCLTEIIDLTERREAIEVKMGWLAGVLLEDPAGRPIEVKMADIVAKADAKVEELEAMMMTGYAGGEKDAATALELETPPGISVAIDHLGVESSSNAIFIKNVEFNHFDESPAVHSV
ncbi:hypothetical protein J3F84DRAFT_353276 [Trichoderma pleuroticola]